MHNLQLTPPLVILVMGYPGSGKTFFARQFAETFKLARISEDRIRFELFENPQFNDDEADIISRVATYMTEEVMQTRQPIICEGWYMSRESRQRLYTLAAQHGYRTLTVWLQTDLETSAARARQRDRRNPDNRYAFPINRVSFDKLRSQLERPDEKEVAVVVSGKHAFKGQSLTVLRKIAALYSENLLRSEPSTPAVMPHRTAPVSRPTRRMVQ